MSARFETRLGLGLLGCLKRRDVARGHRYHRHRRRDMKYIVFLGARVPCGASARNTLNASLKFLLVLELSRSKCLMSMSNVSASGRRICTWSSSSCTATATATATGPADNLQACSHLAVHLPIVASSLLI